ncbi:MAG: hypothetical protein H7Y59_14060 [Anaerolineales bacterium]|nr:hypothetical protein [Anaerolineales bacterium]
MSQFSIYCKDKLVGHSKLESSDPPMGVAFGDFIPNNTYEDVKPEIVVSYGHQEHLELKVFTESGKQIPCIAVAIQDNTAELPEWLIVEVLGIPYPEYEEIFPQHVEAYKNKFKK